MNRQQALILVDIQNDFLPNGSLAVPQGNEVVPIANLLQPHFECAIATQDWHPKNHRSFAVNHSGKSVGDCIELAGLPQILWPEHCVQGTHGAALSTDLNQSRLTKVFHKGLDPDVDSYSGFFDNGRIKATGLADYLKAQSIDAVYIMGLALDYCVKYTVLDACQLGFKTYLIEDGCRAVNLNPRDGVAAIEEMRAAGAIITATNELLCNVNLYTK